MPEGSTEERISLMRAYGAKVTLTPKQAGMEGAIDYAHAAIQRGGALMLDQFANPDNPRAHYETTGPELWRDTAQELTHFVSAMGTTGTIMGVSRYLREVSGTRATGPVQIVGCQPTDGSQIPGIRRWPEAYLPKIYDRSLVDRILDIRQTDAERTARALVKEQGLFVGISAAGAVWAARQICAELATAGRDGVVACILCDRGDRYLSSAVFDAEAP
jgi:cysteine synthase B